MLSQYRRTKAESYRGRAPSRPNQLPFFILWAWDATNSAWYFYVPSLDANGGLVTYINNKGYLDFTATGKSLGVGVGFWVNRP